MLVAGCQVQIDKSGVGHAWVDADEDNGLTATVQQEIEEQIIDAGKESCSDFVASNGLHYRWS